LFIFLAVVTIESVSNHVNHVHRVMFFRIVVHFIMVKVATVCVICS